MSRSSSAQVPVDICNLALGKLGSKFITSITGGDSSNEALQCSNCYYDKVDEILGAAPWNFAQNMVNLAQLNITPPFGNLNIVYAIPTDCVKVNYKNVIAPVKIVGSQIITNATSLGIKYTFRNYNVSTYFPQFKTALACLIAAEICFALTNSVKKAEGLMDEYNEIKLPEAISSDAQQGTPDPVIANEWDNARMVGYPALAGFSGMNVWYPVN